MKKMYNSPFITEEKLIYADVFAASGEEELINQNTSSIIEQDDIQKSILNIMNQS